MKKIFVSMMFVCLALSASAAELSKQGLGFQIGWAQPILRLNDPLYTPADSLMNVTKLNGLKVGVTYDATYIAGFGSSMGINYTFAGGHTDWKTLVGDYPRTRTLTRYHELEVFVDWQYKFEIAKETHLIVYTGPTIQCGLAYNENQYTETQSIWDGSISTTINRYDRFAQHDGEPDRDLKRVNVTWGIGAGFQYQRYFVRGGYDFGLINPYDNQKFTSSLTDRYTRGRLDQWSIKVGMYLWQF